MAALPILAAGPQVQAGQGYRVERPAAASCLVEVIYSEELPVGPLFYHTVKAVLRVIPDGQPPFELTVERVIPWQFPPPRQGQRQRLPCDPGAIRSSLLG